MNTKFYRNELHKELENHGHKLIRDSDGDVDIWQLDVDYHNGPACELCGESWCHHCGSEVEDCPSVIKQKGEE